jgi:hypothetical protein
MEHIQRIYEGQCRQPAADWPHNRLHGPRHLPGLRLWLFHLLLNFLNLHAFAFDIQTEPAKQTHVLVGDPDQGEAADEISTPAGVQQFVSGDDEKNDGHVMAEAVFAGEQVKKLAPYGVAAGLALADTVVSWFSEDLFMGYRPGNTGDGDGDDEKGNNLPTEGHMNKEVYPPVKVASTPGPCHGNELVS